MPVAGVSSRASPFALGRYALIWALAVAAAVGITRLLSGGSGRVAAIDPVTLAAQRAGCVIRTDAGGATPGRLDVMQPPTFGPPSVPAAAGVYTHPPRTEAVVGSLRRGVVVLQYRAGTPRGTIDELRRLTTLAPFESIVTPDRTGMRYAVAATAWGRLLGCPRAGPRTLDAIRAFAVRYRGRGPDATG
jgi:hypothetical protein